MKHYKLVGREVVPCELDEWSQWMAEAERHVGAERIGETLISTVFLGLDHQFHEGGPPLLFETMVFDSPIEGDMMTRCSTYAEAEAMHRAMVDAIRESVEESALTVERASGLSKLEFKK